MSAKCDHIASDLQTQWQDHFHMRDQTWKLLQYSILFFLGVVGLEIKSIEKIFLIPAYCAVMVTSIFGFFIAIHHRKRQKEKFAIIETYSIELGLYSLVYPAIKDSKKGFLGKFSTSVFIIVMQASLFLVSLFLFCRIIFS